jgi:hypothetical protein
MGKSKAVEFTNLNDGGLVPRQSVSTVRAREEARKKEMLRAQLAKEMEQRRKKRLALFAITEATRKEKEAAVAVRLAKIELERKQREEKYNIPLPHFAPRVPQAVREKFFKYAARIASDALWNLHNPDNDPLGDKAEAAARLGEEIPSPTKPPRKKVPAECLKAALRISKLKEGWQKKDYTFMSMERGAARWEYLEKLEKKNGLRVSIHVFIDAMHTCFDEGDRVWLGSRNYLGGRHFGKRLEYRMRRNIWKEQNIPYFASFDPDRQDLNAPTRVVEWDVNYEQDGLDRLKKSGYLEGDEEKVVHLEIF